MTTGRTDLPEDETTSFWYHAHSTPDRIAVIGHDGTSVTFGELASRVNRLSRVFQKLGVTEGEHLSFLVPNRPEWLEVALASTQIGAFFTALSPLLVETEIAYILEDSHARVFVADAAYADLACAAADRASIPPEGRLSIGAIDGFRSIAELAEKESDALPPQRSMGARFQYTSGTTGAPKAVQRRVGGSVAAGTRAWTAVPREMDWGPDDVHLVQGFFSSSGPGGYATFSLQLGSTVVVMQKWDAEGVLQRIDQYGVTSSFAVPTMLRRLLDLPDEVRDRYDVSSLKSVLVSGAPCPVDLKRAVIDWWGPVVWERYGGAELSCSMVNAEDWLAHPGTVGRPFAEVRILNDDFAECPRGEIGTIYFRIKGAPLPQYYNAPEKTQSSVHDGYFTLGDMGYLDEDGWLFLADRKIDMIISGGVNIYPAEIEAVLLAHPAVRDAAVIGLPDPDMGEEVKALIELHRAEEASPALADEIAAFARERLARYKLPRSVEFRESLPRMETGKLNKRLLRDEFASAPSGGMTR